MKQFLLQFFTWWNGQTLGTRLDTWRRQRGRQDEFGNRYYRAAPIGRPHRRWVIYNGEAEASRSRPAGMAGCITASTSRRPEDTTSRANGRNRICRT